MTTSTGIAAPRHAPRINASRRRLAVAAAIGFVVIVTFQVSLMLGAPFGAAAYGGADSGVLASELRVGSAVAAVIWSCAILIVLARGGFTIRAMPAAVTRWAIWILVGLLAVGAAMNAASPSPWERFGWAPLSLALFVLCLRLARKERSA